MLESNFRFMKRKFIQWWLPLALTDWTQKIQFNSKFYLEWIRSIHTQWVFKINRYKNVIFLWFSWFSLMYRTLNKLVKSYPVYNILEQYLIEHEHIGIFHKLIFVNWTRTQRMKEQERGWWWFRSSLDFCFLSFTFSSFNSLIKTYLFEGNLH
jgi:hypothetical protein